MANTVSKEDHAADELHGEMDVTDRKFVAAIGRAFEILRAFKPGEGPMGNAELSAATKLPKPTVSRLTHTLTRLGYLNHLEGAGRYEPSPSILALGYCVLSNMKVRQLAGDYMQQLAEHSGATIGLASRDRLSMIYVAMRNGSTLRTMHLDVGSRAAMETSALGRAFLAGISPEEREYFYGHFARTHGAKWPDLKSRIENCIAQVQERGFCMVDGEWQRDTRAVAAPIISPDGQMVMAMNCAAPTFHITPDKLEQDCGPRLAHLCRGLATMLAS
ncbi:IclR family transcriptional regulator [Ancylobacter polymorphus]|uniref:IclR family transcriptional regulator n=1 Tax=Ancylobacter polymorphus TaxID=223390 RepID=A0A9E7A2E8_9HYPH|nr:IclR family transcriptional regulator [Ancylobacter polymorphus]UOK73305.1 IclR family transcriptional regulator [Ancylobacter polymorphus]